MSTVSPHVLVAVTLWAVAAACGPEDAPCRDLELTADLSPREILVEPGTFLFGVSSEFREFWQGDAVFSPPPPTIHRAGRASTPT